MLRIIPRGLRVALTLTLALFIVPLAACSTIADVGPTASITRAAKQSTPPPIGSPEMATYEWQPTINFIAIAHQGFDDNNRLRPKRDLTKEEQIGVAELSKDCAQQIKDKVRGIPEAVLKRTATGAVLGYTNGYGGAMMGFDNPSDAVMKQVIGLSFVPNTLSAADQAIYATNVYLSAAHAQCVSDRVKMTRGFLTDVVIIMVPTLRGKAPNPTVDRYDPAQVLDTTESSAPLSFYLPNDSNVWQLKPFMYDEVLAG